MEKRFSTHSGNTASKRNSVERGTPARRPGRSGSHSPGSGAAARVGGSNGAMPGARGPLSQSHKHHLEGVLNKYTNLLQGWQNRYFVLDPELGQLQYFLNEQSKTQRPRGSLPLIGASVAPGDEFPHMFTVSAATGEVFKLRAADQRELQLWMMQLQLCARRHSDSSAKGSSSSHASSSSSSMAGRTLSLSLLPHLDPPADPPSWRQPPLHPGGPGSILSITHHRPPASSPRVRDNQQPAGLHQVKEVMSQAEGQQKTLVQSIEALPARGPFSALDQDLLLLKATSAATISCLGECFSILQHNVSQAAQHLTHTPHTGPKAPAMDHARNGGLTTLANSTSTPPSTPANRSSHTAKRVGIEVVDPGEETTDTEDNEEEDLGVLDDQRSVILHLLSQLKLGMDLTRVVLPTFILERRSLLEMYANFMAHPDMFLAVTTATTPEERIVRFVEYYLTAFHEGRRGAVAKKPYNPILGETFCCSWDVPRDRVRPLRPTGSSPAPPLPGGAGRRAEGSEGGGGSYQVRFVAEQVSHHPPVSGFYCECLERKVCVNTHVWTKSKFMGMSIGVSMVGEGVLYLLEHGEEYVFTLPCAYARSILTVPWVELGGKVSISCAKSGYSATITFHTKPFYGGKVHRVTAEVKQNSTGTIVCKAQGEWNGTLEFTYSSGETKVIDTCKLPVIKKKIRPIDKQGPFESRRLWQHVTSALKAGDMDAATGQKHRLEERQRSDERQRGATNTAWEPKYFSKEDDGWVYHNPLWKTH